MPLRSNLHLHSLYSDGQYSIEEIVEVAERSGLDAVAITDHFETTKVRRSVAAEELEDYISEIRQAQRRHQGIKLLAGVEIDTNPERCDLFSLPFEALNSLDLVLFEYVNDMHQGGSSLVELDPILTQLRVPCGLVHTDLERVFSGISPKDLANLLQSYGLFVEANTASLYQREGRQYFELAERQFQAFRGKVKVTVGTDMHRDLEEVGKVDRAYDFLRRLDLLQDLLL
ncbi:MAG: CpsB/CapC family capsule biosynthesis tyrosine phosphatase [Methanomassiliicoccales archaeon]